eukprot:jgi/Mesvir1/16521/Mv10071-RA.1
MHRQKRTEVPGADEIQEPLILDASAVMSGPSFELMPGGLAFLPSSRVLDAISMRLVNRRSLLGVSVICIALIILELMVMSVADVGPLVANDASRAAEFACFAGIASGGCALVVSIHLAKMVLSAPQGNARMVEIAEAIQEGARAFLMREYRYMAVFVGVTAVILSIAINLFTGVAFVMGGFISASTGYFGMSIAVKGNVRTAAAAERGLDPALRVAFNTGTVMGMMVVGCGLAGLSLVFLIMISVNGIEESLGYLAGFGFGASSIALFARVGGGIFTKAADVGADLVGKVEAGIPEDDPRNPAVIADNVGDNVGDVAGMGADLFESYVGSVIAAAALGYHSDVCGEEGCGAIGVALPFLVASLGIICSIAGTLYVRTQEGASQEDLLKTMRMGTVMSSLFVLVAIGLVVLMLGITAPMQLYAVMVVGLVSGILVGGATEYCTSHAFAPVLSIARSALTGPATVIIQGLAVGMFSTVAPVIVITVAIMISLKLAGVFGVAIAAVAMLSTLGITLATDAYGPVADNAGGIAEMAEMPSHVRERTDTLDGLGNTTAATGKGFAISSAVLTSLALLSAFQNEASDPAHPLVVDVINDHQVMPGLLLGSVLPFVFAAFTMLAVGKSAGSIIEEVRRQFRLGILEGTAKPDYAACVDIATASSLQQMMPPGLMAVVVPILVGFLLGPKALAGVLTGAILTGALLAIMMANAGGAWDNCKKYIEAGSYGGKGSECHKAAVVGDTVGDPFKDTSGPALNILIKLMSIIALCIAPALKKIWLDD